MRTKNSIKNIVFSLGSYFISIFLSFANRTVFIYTLGTEYLGINGVFGDILMWLSFANLGIGSVIVFSLYKPLAEKDDQKIKALMSFYQTAYRVIGIVVMVLGLSLLPFLNIFMKDPPDIPHLNTIYCLYVFQSASSYFFVYKKSIITADQKEYMLTTASVISSILSLLASIIILILWKNYILVLCVQILIVLIRNVFCARLADKKYPVIRDVKKYRLNKADKTSIYRNVFALVLYNLSYIVVNGTDRLVMSSFIGLTVVALYSQYSMIVSTIKSILGQLFNSITPSVGNLNATESDEKKFSVFNNLFFLYFWLYGFCSICLYVLLNPFITFWLGKSFTSGFGEIIALILFDFLTDGINSCVSMFKGASGLYWYGKWGALASAVINIVVSIILVQHIGLAGVFIGTIISRVTTYFWIDPVVTHKHIFKKPVIPYFIKLTICVGIVCLTAYLTSWAADMLFGTTVAADGARSLQALLNLLGRAALCLIIPNAIFFLISFKTQEFKYFKEMGVTILKKLRKNVKSRKKKQAQ